MKGKNHTYYCEHCQTIAIFRKKGKTTQYQPVPFMVQQMLSLENARKVNLSLVYKNDPVLRSFG